MQAGNLCLYLTTCDLVSSGGLRNTEQSSRLIAKESRCHLHAFIVFDFRVYDHGAFPTVEPRRKSSDVCTYLNFSMLLSSPIFYVCSISDRA